MHSGLCTGCARNTMQRDLCMQAEVPHSIMQDCMIVLSLQQAGPIITESIAAEWASSAYFVLRRALCRVLCTVQYCGQSATAAV